jgi:DNA-binding NtrC family response regulator
MAPSSAITAADLGLQPAPEAAPATEEMTLEESERLFIQKVLARHGGDVRKAAEQLGVSRSALYRRLQQFGL